MIIDIVGYVVAVGVSTLMIFLVSYAMIDDYLRDRYYKKIDNMRRKREALNKKCGG